MTVITVTAVGFREVQPLSGLGQDFTMGLLAAGITGVGVWFALITSFIVEFDLGHVRGGASPTPNWQGEPSSMRASLRKRG